MSKEVKISPFYGGGFIQGKSQKNSPTAPLQGDPIDDMIARTKAEWKEKGVSEEELRKRWNEEPFAARVVITKNSITLEGHKMDEKLNPSVRAFYILICRHPEGITKGHFHDDYLDEYQDIFYALERKHEEKEEKMTFELDKRAPRYRDDIRKAIEEIEKQTGLNLSSCKIYGKLKWKITTKYIDDCLGNDSHIVL